MSYVRKCLPMSLSINVAYIAIDVRTYCMPRCLVYGRYMALRSHDEKALQAVSL